MAEIQWIKIVTDIFDNRKIRLLEKMPDGDSIIVIWFKLLCLAGQTNDNGLIYLTREVPYTPEMLADYFNRPISTVKMALMAFERFEMIEVVNDIILLPGWEKYQSQEALERIREQNRKRVAKHRERQKALAAPKANALPGNVTCNVTCNDNVMPGNAIEEEKEIDKDKEIDGDIEEKSTAELPAGPPGVITPDPKPAKASRFKPPTLEEVRAYCLERGNSIDPEKFHAYYESVKWYRGKTKIQDWKACVRTWESKERSAPGQAQRQQQPPPPPPTRKGGNVFLDILNDGV